MDKYLKLWQKPNELKSSNDATSSKQLQNSSEDLENSDVPNKLNDESTLRGSELKVTSKWLEQFSWLRYNKETQKAFCNPCTQAYDGLRVKVPPGSVNNNRVYNSFVRDGFSNWKKSCERFKAHERTDVHRHAVASICSQKNTDVSHMISNQLSKEKAEARFCLIKIFETIRFLAVQGLPIRGHTEINSNFIQLLHLRAEDCEPLKNWMQRSKYRWVSHDIINEILNMMSLHILRILVSIISKQLFYAIMSDETTDSSRKEQMSLNFRIVDENLKISEIFLGFYDVPTTDSATLFFVIKDVISRFDLQLNKCRGQCYDGANNMSGDYTGLQTRVREVEPRAFYVHCAGHNVSLVAQDAMKKIPEIADFLSVLKDLITFVRASAKRINIFKNIQLQTDDADQNEEIVSLRPFCPTRWTVRVKSLKSVKANYRQSEMDMILLCVMNCKNYMALIKGLHTMHRYVYNNRGRWYTVKFK